MQQNDSALPLMLISQHTANIALFNNELISRKLFLSHVYALAAKLPASQYVINLCKDRYHFMVSFAAAILSGQINLLPSNQSTHEIEALSKMYPDSVVITNEPDVQARFYVFNISDLLVNDEDFTVPRIPEDREVAIVFTSGSTGQAQPHIKTWGELVTGNKLLAERFGFDEGRCRSIVATVVPQHMYGLETSILLPMLHNVCVNSARPFFPIDIVNALKQMPAPSILVSTPLHIKACCQQVQEWPELAFVLSATSPLSKSLAKIVSTAIKTDIKEIFGCTEAGSFASRSLLSDSKWKLYDNVYLKQKNNSFTLQSDHYPGAIPLSDKFELINQNHFTVSGRDKDLLNIAGKRASLADLNHKLTSITGVEDGVYFLTDDADSEISCLRITAFVVAPKMSCAEILACLRDRIDPVYLPRPLIKVDALPYNDIGKLPRSNLMRLCQQHLANNNDY